MAFLKKPLVPVTVHAVTPPEPLQVRFTVPPGCTRVGTAEIVAVGVLTIQFPLTKEPLSEPLVQVRFCETHVAGELTLGDWKAVTVTPFAILPPQGSVQEAAQVFEFADHEPLVQV